MNARLAILLAVHLGICTGSGLRAQFPGALFTTGPNGQTVPGDLYAAKANVHLYFGPGMNCQGSVPATGDYFFQVTDPSGLVLLSTDPIQSRRISVSFGVITAATGGHIILNGPCPDSKVVRLIPFADTPHPHGEYKVWITPVGEWDKELGGFHGFIADKSRTDNFRVLVPGGTPVLQTVFDGYAFYDADQDGVWQPGPGEAPLAGWRVELWRNGILDGVTFADETGRYEFLRDRDGATYEIREIAPAPGYIPAPGGLWLATTPVSATAMAGAAHVPGPDFGNVVYELSAGAGRSKGFWHNEGHKLLADCDPDWRDYLNQACLRNPISSADPQISIYLVPAEPVPFILAFADFSMWIVGLPAQGHAGYMLSTQVAATILNNTCGFMTGPVYIDRFQNGQLVSLAEMLQGAIGLLCAPGAGLTRPKDPPQPSPIPGVDLRTAMLNCLNEFDTINNTGSLTEPQVVFKSVPEKPGISSPYGDG
jgi:hypothetical protein